MMRRIFDASFVFWLCHTAAAASCFNQTRGSCWDLGVEYDIDSAERCQRRCLLWPNCQAFMYLSEVKKCHLCSDPILDWIDNCDDGCVFGPATCPGNNQSPTLTDILQSSIRTAASVCTDEIKIKSNTLEDGLMTQEYILQATTDLHQIIRFRDLHNQDETFSKAYDEAVEETATILASSDCNSTCAGLLKLQLQSMILLEDYKATSRAFPKDAPRAKLFDDFRILLADNGYLTDDSVDSIRQVFHTLPDHLLELGVIDGAPFVVQYLPDTFQCETSIHSLVDFSNITYSISPAVQVNEAFIQTFPIDTEDMPPPGDKLLTMVKHQIATKFYGVVNDNPRLSAMLNFLYLQSKQGNNSKHWLGMDEPEFYANNPTEIFAAQIGQQYMRSSSSQLQLAINRWGAFAENTSQSVSQGIFCETIDKDLGTNYTSRLGCRRAARNDTLCNGNFFMYNDDTGDCKCCSADTEFKEDSIWTVYKYRDNSIPRVPTPLPLSWWLLNVDIFAGMEKEARSTFYEYGPNGAIVPVCVRLFRDEMGRIETIDVPGCGFLDFEYSQDDEFLVESVTDNALECRPNPSINVCTPTLQTLEPTSDGNSSGGLSIFSPRNCALTSAAAILLCFCLYTI